MFLVKVGFLSAGKTLPNQNVLSCTWQSTLAP